MIRLLVLVVLCGAVNAMPAEESVEQFIKQSVTDAAAIIRNIDVDAAMKNVEEGKKLAMSTLDMVKDFAPDRETAQPLVEDGLKLLNKGIKVAQDQAFKNPQLVQEGLELALSKPALWRISQDIVAQIIKIVKATQTTDLESVVEDVKKAVESVRAEEMVELVAPIADLLAEGSEVLANHRTEIEGMLKDLLRDDELFDAAEYLLTDVVDALYTMGPLEELVETFGGMALHSIQGTTMFKDAMGVVNEENGQVAGLVEKAVRIASVEVAKILKEEPIIYMRFINLANQYPELFTKIFSSALDVQSKLLTN